MSIARNLPLFILPCSASKLRYAAKAEDLYQGKGYLPVIKNKQNVYSGRNYNLAFMSAKHGLVMSDEIIFPYEQIMSIAQSNWLVENLSQKTKDKVSHLRPSKIIACLPKLYLTAFERMVKDCQEKFNLVKPAKGSGIGHQRQFLSLELDKLTPNVATFFLFYDISSKKHLAKTTCIEIRVGDTFTPYVGGVGDDKLIGEPVAIKAITIAGGVPCIFDEYNRTYTTKCIANGLSEPLKEAAKKYSGFYELGMDLSELLVPLSILNKHVLQTHCGKTFKLSACI